MGIILGMQRRCLLMAVAIVLIHFPGLSQDSSDLVKKNLTGAILERHTLLMPDPFNAQRALIRLFPGKYYNLGHYQHPDRLISWECKTCKRIIYPDVNGVEDPTPFPYPEGVASRLLSVFGYSDDSGRNYKVMSFNHSSYDPDGIQTGRFSGGLLGMAKFIKTDSGWELQTFQPAIAAYGSFSQSPLPQPILMGKDQYGFMIGHVNGGAGGPYSQDYFMLAEINGVFKQILSAYGMGRTKSEDKECAWTSTYTFRHQGGIHFRNLIIVCKGEYWGNDSVGLPDELRGKVEGKDHGDFTIVHIFKYDSKKGYLENVPAWVSVRRK